MVRINRQLTDLKSAFALVFTGFLYACGGGGGGGNVTLTTDGQGEDPVIVEIPVAFIKRPLVEDVPDIRDPIAFFPGARLFVRGRSATSAEDVDVSAMIAEIVAEEEGVTAEDIALDIKDIESSFDGATLVFAVRAVPEPVDANLEDTTWNLWTYDIAARQASYVISSRIKRNEGVETGAGHDIAPHFLPDDRIVFSSTRQVASQGRQLNEGRIQLFAALDESGRRPAAVLHIFDPQLRGDEFQQISFNLSHDLDPVVLSTGEIVFSRWNNTATNHISLYRIDPAGLGASPLFGFHSQNSGDGGAVVYSQPRELDDGRLAVVLREPASSTLGGSIVFLDTTNFADVDQPLWDSSGVAGSGQDPLTPREIRTDGLLSRGGQFGSVFALRDDSGRLLVSWSDCRVIDEDATEPVVEDPEADQTTLYPPCSLQPENENPAPPLYGGWLYDPLAETQRPVVIPEEGFAITELIAAEPRDFSAVLPLPEDYNSELAQQQRGQLLIDSVYDFDGVDESPAGIAQHAQPGTPSFTARPARFLRIYQPVPIPDRDVFEIPPFAAGFAGGLGFREILGYVPVEPDGSVTAVLPSGRPLSFDVVDSRGRRIGARHNYWLQLGAGEVLRCTGCHDHASGLPHGRVDSQPPSSNPGAVALANGSLGFPATNADELFAQVVGDSMAEVWNANRPAGNTAATARELGLFPVYTDQWHSPAVAAEAAIEDRDYSTEWPDIPADRRIVVNSFDPGQPSRIVINYIDHLQPMWEREREARLDSDGNEVTTCIGCHSTAEGAVVPAGQLDLTSAPSAIEPEHYRSYRELLAGDDEQWLDADGNLGNRERLCTLTDAEGNTITVTETVPVSASQQAGSANASVRFFSCFEGGACGPPDAPALPANCVEGEGEPVPATRNTVDHVGLLSETELHLVSEWLDLGAQYFNNPFDDRLVE
ncbi:MAG: hypothetical protein Hals2KO_31420 [Halioglobus sp.]